MKCFEITQKVLGLEATYEVRPEGEESIAMTLKGTGAIMRLLEGGEDGAEIASFRMKSVLSETKYEVYDGEGALIGRFEFPIIELKKHFTLTVGESTFTGQGGLRGRTFRFKDDEDKLVLEIKKHSSFKDVYTMKISKVIPTNVGVLATAVVDQKHFERRG